MTSSKRALLIYYSFTEQARIGAELAAAELERLGHVAEIVRMDFADASRRLKRPMPFKDQTYWGNLAEKGTVLPLCFDHPEKLRSGYDLVLLLSNTWKFHPSVPMQSFLASPEAASVLRDTPFAVLVICRGFWRKNLRIVREKAERLGGRFVGGDGFGFAGSWLASTVQSVRYVAGTGESERRWGLLSLPAFGLSREARERLQGFVREIAAR